MNMLSKTILIFKKIKCGFLKLKKENRVMLIIALSLILLIFLSSFVIKIVRYADYIKLDVIESLTLEEMATATQKIFLQNMGFESGCSVYFWDGKYDFDVMNKYYGFSSVPESKLARDTIFVSNDGGGSLLLRHFSPTEIMAAFDCIMYFEEKNLPGEFIGVANSQTTGGLSNYRSNATFVSVAEYEKLCQEIDITGLSRRKAAKKLAEAWIEKHNYVKR